MSLDYWNWLYHRMKGADMEKKEAQPFGSVGTPEIRIRIAFNQTIVISGSDGKWENIITLTDLPWLLGKLNSTAAEELRSALQKTIDDFHRKLRVMV